ncbi:MAG: hypothetical protein AB7T31_02520 [Gemmatimonadales bacterium]
MIPPEEPAVDGLACTINMIAPNRERQAAPTPQRIRYEEIAAMHVDELPGVTPRYHG